MSVLGIICEYNPFHNGHACQINYGRQLIGSEGILIALMSGNVVQRGEFACIDKWTRAAAACQHGADLVIELPLLATLQSADYFAEFSIRLLSALGCQSFLYGTETATDEQLRQIVDWQEQHHSLLQNHIQAQLKQGKAYNVAFQNAWQEVAPKNMAINPFSPNHLLGLQYLSANAKLPQPLKSYALERAKVDLEGKPILSGSAIRQQAVAQPNSLKLAVPMLVAQMLNNHGPVTMEDYWPFLRYKLTVSSPSELATYYGAKEGIQNRLKEKLAEQSTYSQYISDLKTKRWSYNQFARLLLSILLNIKDDEWRQAQDAFWHEPNLRLLAFSSRGQAYLNQNNANLGLDIWSNLRKNREDSYRFNLQADRVYQLNPEVKIAEQIRARYPITYSP
ncbi:tRNA(Met) cytidine acetate ligase [Vaginisenegalia massiliensis]|uniref:tRNA(Met) cytidine acetate ligase n=1 Tax=Vaginisenegalia massiliensis TaxID=2058294 RepID=UPI0013DDE8B4|nr:nucleotidyltransferase family protein [Vaginisenegalia massiliensis]